MERALRRVQWKRPDWDAYADVTDAVENAVVSATPYPDEGIDRPKGYSVLLRLRPDSTELAAEIRRALMSFETVQLTLEFEAGEEVAGIPAGVSKMPHLGEQNTAEFSVKPDGHDLLREHF